MSARSVVPTAAVPRGEGRTRTVAAGLILGVVVAVAWSFQFVDETIGDSVANALLGYDARESAITGSMAGAVFAFVSGLAGTFTACNIAAFSALAPMVGQERHAGRRLLAAVRPLAWIAAGMLTVSASYGALGVLFADRLPQLSTATTGAGMPVRLLQSSVVFGVIGLAFVYLGLSAVGVVRDPFARLRERFAAIDFVVLGALIGAFLIGRPFGLFFKMFQYAADQHNALYGAATFALQSVGNVVLMALLLLGVLYGTRGRLFAWLSREPGRAARLSGGAFLAAGSFTFVYWVVRVPALFGYGWFPTMPWN